VRKSARVGVSERDSNIGYWDSFALEQSSRDFEACFVDQFAEGRALRLQSAVQRSRLHCELTCNFFQGSVGEHHPSTQHAADRMRHALPVSRPLLYAKKDIVLRHWFRPIERIDLANQPSENIGDISR